MKLYNTLTKSVNDFAPLDRQTARIYSCGPTVYNHAHIGNLSSYIYADLLRRVVGQNFATQHVMNLTDVDDKTIRDSAASFPDLAPRDALTKLTRHYEEVFLREMREVGNDVDAIKFVRATDSIAEIQALIRQLLRDNFAYLADDGIYFDIAKYVKSGKKYGQLSQIAQIDEQVSRIDNDEYDKGAACDFALWKRQKAGEPAWEFEIDGEDLKGRPGWHIECSAMSVANLGQPFDIHTGGVDLIFPHHENEIAQSTAGARDNKLANFFVHNEFMLVDGAKMSKSAHNFYTLPDLVARGFSALDFRMLVLQSHYRSATNFSWENLTAAQNRLRHWRNVAELRWQKTNQITNSEQIVRHIQQARAALENDLDTPRTLPPLDQAFDRIAQNFDAAALDQLLDCTDQVLGLQIRTTTPNLDETACELLEQRSQARTEKNWAKSDELRDELNKLNIEVSDAQNQTVWSRK